MERISFSSRISVRVCRKPRRSFIAMLAVLTLDVQVSIILNPAGRAYRIPWIFSA